jgi:hypothetical protein
MRNATIVELPAHAVTRARSSLRPVSSTKTGEPSDPLSVTDFWTPDRRLINRIEPGQAAA